MNKKYIKKITLIFSSFVLSWFFIHTAIISIDGLFDDAQRADFAVVLGNTVTPQGEPSSRLKGRLDAAMQLYLDKKVRYILVSGATGIENKNEALVMKKYLVSNGIPENFILTDLAGKNTFLTAQNSRKIADENNLKSVFVVSQYFHISRCKLAFKKAGFTEVYSVHADYFELRDIYSLVREFLAYYYYFIMK